MKTVPPPDELRALLLSADVLTRHRAGVLLAAIKAQETYGSRRLEQIADTLGVHVSSLYRFARIAECWSEAELAELLARANAAKVTIAWSHLVHISDVEDPAERARLVERVLRERLSARALRQPVVDGDHPVLFVRRASLVRLKNVAKTLHDEGRSWLRPHAAEKDPPRPELLAQMLRVQRAIHATSGRQVRLLEREMERALRGRAKEIFAPRGDKR